MSWDPPSNSGGDGILIEAYVVEIYDYSASVLYAAPGCDGTDPTVVSTQTCEVEMDDLIAWPFTLS